MQLERKGLEIVVHNERSVRARKQELTMMLAKICKNDSGDDQCS
jgi:hypothetical protein